MTNNVLVIGGGGFLGSHLLEELLKHDGDINLKTFTKKLFERHYWFDKDDNMDLESIEGDIRDKETLDKAMKGIDLVYHLAAQGNPDRSIQDPYETNEINVLGTINVLNAALKNNVQKVLYMSTSEVYGNALTVPMNEDHPLNPRTPYGASKLGGEMNAYAFHQTYGLPVVIIRGFNFFGPRQRIGKNGGVIANFIYGMLNGHLITISGDGSQTRDYVYVKDIARNLIRAIESNIANADPINLATESEISIKQIADMVKDITGSSSEITYKDERPGDVNRLYGSNKKAKELIGFKLDYDFRRGLTETIEWQRRYLTLLNDPSYSS